MAAEPFNSLAGYTVGIPPVEVIDSNGNIVSNFLNLSGNVSANKVYANSYFYANGQPFNANPGGSNTQLQFNNNGALGGIPNVTFDGTILNLGDITTLSIGGGENGYFLQTDGSGNLTWAVGGGGGNGSPGGSNTQVQFNDNGTFGGDIGFTYNKITNTLNVENISAGNTADDVVNIIGNLAVTGNANVTTDIDVGGNLVAVGNVTGEYLLGNGYYITGLTVDIANYVAQPNQSNITSVGTLIDLSVAGNIDTTGNITISGDYSGSNLSLGGNLSAANATISTKVTVGSNLTVNSSGTLRVAGSFNSIGSPNVSLGTLANIKITGGSMGQVITTDGTGNLYWSSGGGGGNGSPGGTNQSVQFNFAGDFGGDTSFIYDTDIQQLQVPNIKSNTTANFAGASTVNLGAVANLKISGGFNGYVLTTDGSGNLSWSASGGGGNGVPGGSNTQVQYNDNGTFGADAFFTYNNTTKTVQVGGNLIANSFQMGSGIYKWSTSLVYFASTSSSSPDQVLYSIPVTEISGIEFEIIATSPASLSRQFCKISAIQYDDSVQYTEYATLVVNNLLGNFTVGYNAGNLVVPPSLELKTTPSTINPITYKMLITRYSP